MRKKGRGRDYKKALFANLVKSLVSRKRIITTQAKAKHLKSLILKEHGGAVQTVLIGRRRGDNAKQVVLEWKGEKNFASLASKNAKNKNNKKRTNKKKLASS